MRIFLLWSVAMFGLLSCAKEQDHVSQAEAQHAREADGSEVSELISFYRLIARSEDYDGKTVSTFGYLEVDQQHNTAYLYPTTEAMRHAIIVDKLVLKLSDERWLQIRDLNSRYVTVSGVFQMETQPSGEYIEFGSLDPVVRLIDMQSD